VLAEVGVDLVVGGLLLLPGAADHVADLVVRARHDATDLADLKPLKLHNRTPLWFYVLREAEVKEEGKQLGPVGGRIVAEVFIGLMEGDAMSYLKQDPGWTPTLPSAAADTFKMTDLLKFAGVVAPL
jgi:hypothetical protein